MELFSLCLIWIHTTLSMMTNRLIKQRRKKWYKKCLNEHAGSGNSDSSRCFFWLGWSQQFRKFHFHKKASITRTVPFLEHFSSLLPFLCKIGFHPEWFTSNNYIIHNETRFWIQKREKHIIRFISTHKWERRRREGAIHFKAKWCSPFLIFLVFDWLVLFLQ